MVGKASLSRPPGMQQQQPQIETSDSKTFRLRWNLRFSQFSEVWYHHVGGLWKLIRYGWRSLGLIILGWKSCWNIWKNVYGVRNPTYFTKFLPVQINLPNSTCTQPQSVAEVCLGKKSPWMGGFAEWVGPPITFGIHRLCHKCHEC